MVNQKKLVAVLNDLLFRVKIQEAAKRAGLEVVFVQSQAAALQQAQYEPLNTIEKLKSDAGTRGISLLGYVSHVQTDIIKAAQEKGCDAVMARSAFSQNLPKILSRYNEETVN